MSVVDNYLKSLGVGSNAPQTAAPQPGVPQNDASRRADQMQRRAAIQTSGASVVDSYLQNAGVSKVPVSMDLQTVPAAAPARAQAIPTGTNQQQTEAAPNRAGATPGSSMNDSYMGSSLQRGWNTLKAAFVGQKLSTAGEMLDAFNRMPQEELAKSPEKQKDKAEWEKIFADLSAEYSSIQNENEDILLSPATRPETRKMLGVDTPDQGWWDSAKRIGSAIIEDPRTIIDLGLSSAPATIAAVVSSIAAARSGPVGAAAAGGAASGYVEFGNEYADNRAQGMSHDEAWKKAALKSGVVGALDAVSMKTAGNALESVIDAAAAGGGTRAALSMTAKETGRQAALGAAGEAGGSIAAGEEVDPTSVMLEAVGETVTAPAEAVSNRVDLFRNTPENRAKRALDAGLNQFESLSPGIARRQAIDALSPAGSDRPAVSGSEAGVDGTAVGTAVSQLAGAKNAPDEDQPTGGSEQQAQILSSTPAAATAQNSSQVNPLDAALGASEQQFVSEVAEQQAAQATAVAQPASTLTTALDAIKTELGIDAAETLNVTEVTDDTRLNRLGKALETAFGVKVHWVDFGEQLTTASGKQLGAFDGFRHRDTILLTRGKDFIDTTWHELTHVLETRHPDVYRALRDKVVPSMDPAERQKLVNDLNAARQREVGRDLTASELDSELVAYTVGRLAQNPDTLLQMFDSFNDPGLARQFRDVLMDILDKLLSVVKGPQYITERKQLVASQKAVVNAFAEFQKRETQKRMAAPPAAPAAPQAQGGVRTAAPAATPIRTTPAASQPPKAAPAAPDAQVSPNTRSAAAAPPPIRFPTISDASAAETPPASDGAQAARRPSVAKQLRERGEQVADRTDAERRWSNGQRIYTFSEQDGAPSLVTSPEMLASSLPEQMLALPPETAEEQGGAQAARKRTPSAPEKAAEPAPEPAAETATNAAPEKAAPNRFRLDIERTEREFDESLGLSRKELQAINSSAKALKVPPRIVRQLKLQAAETKRRYPPSAGWEELVAKGVSVPEGSKPEDAQLEWQAIPYKFNVPDGIGKAPSKIDQKWADQVADEFYGFIKQIYDRAETGDRNAQVILSHKGWYRNVAEVLRREFGAAGDLLADLLGATSPNTPVDTNWKFSIDIMRRFVRGDFNAELAKFAKYVADGKDVSKYPAADKVKQISGKLYGMNSTNAMLAMLNTWRQIHPGQAPKARNFALNLIMQSTMATIDVWAARMLRRAASKAAGKGFSRIPPPAENKVTGKWNASATLVTGEFGFGAQVMEQVAQRLRAEGVDVTAPDLQAIAWFAEKELWTKNNWTSAQGEGGSFEENIENAPMERFLAGWSIQQGEVVPEEGASSVAQARVLGTLRRDNSVIAARVKPTVGLYGGTVEQSFDTEWTVESGKHDPSLVMAEIAQIAKDNSQYDIFVSKVIKPDENNANARPGVEVYFRDQKALNAAMPVLNQFTSQGVDGFTMAVDPRADGGKYIGVRLQYVPEISMRWDESLRSDILKPGAVEQLLQDKFQQLNDIAAQVSTMDGVAFSKAYQYDTVVVGKENYDDYIDRAASGGDQKAGGKVWFGQPVRDAVERAASRLNRDAGQVDAGRVPDAGSAAAEREGPAALGFKRRVGPDVRSLESAVRPREGGGVTLSRARQPDAQSYVGVHFGNVPGLAKLSGAKSGTGIKGEEATRLNSKYVDPRIKKRVYFYINYEGLGQASDGKLPRPEVGLGNNLYTQQFDNILPPGPKTWDLWEAASKRAKRGGNADNHFESAVIDAGYDGYAVPKLGMMVILNHDAPVNYVGRVEGSGKDAKIKRPKGGSFARRFEQTDERFKTVTADLSLPVDAIRERANAKQRTARPAAPPKPVAYNIVNSRTGEVVGKATSLKGARAAVDRRDNAYGAYVHRIQIVDPAADLEQRKKLRSELGLPPPTGERTGNAFARRLPTVEVDGVQRPALNSEGRRIFPTDEGVRNFWRWFGDSKVVDEQGRPLVVYHGTTRDFSQFDLRAERNMMMFRDSQGFYFTKYKQDASAYTESSETGDPADGANIMPVYLRIENPQRTESVDDHPAYISEERRAGMEADGYDGVIHRDGLELVVFDPTQVKSATGNNGNFDGSSGNVNFARRRPAVGGRFVLPSRSFRERYIENAFENRFSRAEDVQQAVVAQGGTLDIRDAQGNVVGNTDISSAAARMRGAVRGRLDRFKKEVQQPLIEEAAKLGVNLDEVAQYLYATYAPERNAIIQQRNPTQFPVDGGSGMTNAEALQIVSTFRARPDFQSIERIADGMKRITRMTQQLLLSEGLVEPQVIAQWQRDNPNYVPLRGFEDFDEDTGNSVGNSRLDPRNPFVKTAKGRTSRAGMIVENILKDYTDAVVLAEKNKVYRLLLQFVRSNPDPTLWQVNAPTVSRSYYKAGMTPLGYAQGTVRIAYDVNENPNETIAVRVQGKTAFIQINDAGMMEDLQMQSTLGSGEQAQLFYSVWGGAMQTLAKLRTTLSPAFVAIDAIRNVETGGVWNIVKYGPRTAGKAYARLFKAGRVAWNMERDPNWAGGQDIVTVNIPGQPRQTMTMAQLYDMYRADGGKVGYLDIKDVEDVQREIMQNYRIAMAAGSLDPRTYHLKMLGALNGAEELMMDAAGSIETSMRFATYVARLEGGATRQEATDAAKNVTVNFDRKGKYTPQLGMLYMFANASIQGTRGIYNLIFKSGKAGYIAGASLIGLGYMVAQTAAMVGGDDDEPYWDKQLYKQSKLKSLLFFTPDGNTVTIPMAYGLGFFVNLGYALADLQRGVPLAKVGAFVRDSFFTHFSPFGTLENPATFAAPTMLDPLLVTTMNMTEMGIPLMPDSTYEPGTPDSEKFWAASRGTMFQEFTRYMNEATGGTQGYPGAIDVSPESLRYWTSWLTGGTGGFARDIAETIYLTSEIGLDSAVEKNKIPILRSFHQKNTGKQNQVEFYRNSEEALARLNEWKLLYGTEKIAEEETSQRINDQMFVSELGAAVDNYRKALNALRAEEVDIIDKRSAGFYDAAEAEQLLKDRAEQRNQLYIDFNREFYRALPDKPSEE